MTEGGAKPLRVLSFGGGVQTTALAVLLVRGEIEADAVVMADTGGETPETYRHVEIVKRYLKAHGIELHTVEHADGVTLEDWTLNRSTPIPIRTRTSFGKRQCTNQWKINPVKRFAREHGAKQMQLTLGISMDEITRMKPDRAKWIERQFPLIDLRLTRNDARTLTAESGLPDAPKSACFYCPLQGADRWRWLNAEHPDLIERTEAMEQAVNARRKDAAYFTSALVPVRQLVTAGAMLPGMEAEECEGVCEF